MPNQKIYALDFDGVICDSATETGITGWKAATQLWTDMPAETPDRLLDLFRQVRPAIATGYEAILIMRLLFEGTIAQILLDDFAVAIAALVERDNLSIAQLKHQFGATRDHWINQNLAAWVAMNPLFDGIAEKLKYIGVEQGYIITTKQERFVSQILAANGITLPPQRIFGLDRKMSKPQILTSLLKAHCGQTMLFVEDRLATLIDVLDDEQLSNIELFFASWGYNTQQDKSTAAGLAVRTINLADFSAL